MTYKGGSSNFWDDYDGTDAPQEGSDFWSDYDMQDRMREADEIAIAQEENNELLNNVDLALEGYRDITAERHYSTTTGRRYTASGNCRICGQRYGHAAYCPHFGGYDIGVDHRLDAQLAFSDKEWKASLKVNRGGPDASTGSKPTAVIVDMDGTIDDAGRANHFGISYVRKMHNEGHLIVIITARTHEYEYERTHKWLVRELSHKYAIPFVGPFCRAKDDRRWACDFKKAVHDSLSGMYDFVGAIDDDKWCLAKWRTLKTLEVVEAKPAVYQVQSWRRSAKRTNYPSAGKHRKKGED